MAAWMAAASRRGAGVDGRLDGGGVAVRSVSQCAEIQYAVVHSGIPPCEFAVAFQEYFSTGGGE